MNEIFLPVMIVLVASFFQGTFGIGMKYVKPLAWEAWWLVHATVAMIIFPLVWASLAVPDLWGSIAATPGNVIFMSMLFGFLWGIGGIMFGVSVQYVGVALTMGIVMGLAASGGSLVPFFLEGGFSTDPKVPYVLGGIAVMLIGVIICAKAGINRDKEQASAGKSSEGIQQGSAFRKGLIIAIVCGLLSSLINIGFWYAQPVAKEALILGAIPRNSSLAAWVVVLLGAYLMNILYALFLLFKNKSWNTFKVKGAFKGYKWSIIAGLLWFAALGTYGQGSALMGDLGPIIGWPMLLGLSMVVSNIIAVKLGEWNNAKKPLKMMISGLVVLVIATCILGYSNSIKTEQVEAAPTEMGMPE